MGEDDDNGQQHADSERAAGQGDLVALVALHFAGGGSDKVWGAAIVQHVDQTAALLTCWGRRGASLSAKHQPFATVAQAEAQYTKKLREKHDDQYHDIAPADYGIAATLERLAAEHGVLVALSTAVGAVGAGSAGTQSPAAETGRGPGEDGSQPLPLAPRLRLSHITVLATGELDAVLDETDRYGVTEKVNGARLVVRCDAAATGAAAGHLRAYNRRGLEQLSLPAGAQEALSQLATPCVVDGERMEGALVGTFVAFDLLEWHGEDLRQRPYTERITRLEDVLRGSGVVVSGAPTLVEALACSRVTGFALLTPAVVPAEKRAVLARVQAAGGEDIIVRTLAAPTVPGDTPYERKHKLLASIDVVAVGIKPGVGAGSVRMGLVRERDHAVIEVGSVRSGLTDRGVETLGAALARGEQPVLDVTFLPARTVGLSLVEPVVVRVRTDKRGAECTTTQLVEVFGPARQLLIDAAGSSVNAVAPAAVQADPTR